MAHNNSYNKLLVGYIFPCLWVIIWLANLVLRMLRLEILCKNVCVMELTVRGGNYLQASCTLGMKWKLFQLILIKSLQNNSGSIYFCCLSFGGDSGSLIFLIQLMIAETIRYDTRFYNPARMRDEYSVQQSTCFISDICGLINKLGEIYSSQFAFDRISWSETSFYWNLLIKLALEPECSIFFQGVVSLVCGGAKTPSPLPPDCVGPSSTTPQPSTSPTPTLTHSQQPDTGDERSRQACKRGVPSRPACLSDRPAELRPVNPKLTAPRAGPKRTHLLPPSSVTTTTGPMLPAFPEKPTVCADYFWTFPPDGDREIWRDMKNSVASCKASNTTELTGWGLYI